MSKKFIFVRYLFIAVVLALSVFLGAVLRTDIPECLAASPWVLAAPQGWGDEVNLLSRLIMGEATGEPLTGQVGVGAVILNRVRSPEFPSTVSGVVYDPWAFESVENGLIWTRNPSAEEVRAAELALNGWDPTYGALFFWNPSKPVSPWIWSRSIIVQIGQHVFAR
ncbi:MAG TPA: spore cortex-lytic protein [Firmicutes bacterium]|jgi:N-acetylmuramoyl-L-alanine amidase|nr:spore cortex-lytic protein [Bacillota bacterium]